MPLLDSAPREPRLTQNADGTQSLWLAAPRYALVYADPPWRYDFASTKNRRIENQYPTMSLSEIKALDVPSILLPNAVLYLWATAPKLREALDVMHAWGFDYKSCAVWDKGIMGMGYWFRGQHELLLVGTHHYYPPPPAPLRRASVFRERRGKHSAKPVCVYEALEAMYPMTRKVELFARTTRPGWDVWGNETTTETIPLTA